MKRREFINAGVLTALAGTIATPILFASGKNDNKKHHFGKAKNIIFFVSDGMSPNTLSISDLLSLRKYGHGSKWIDLYRENRASRALMDTSSANSLVTDSAAASSAWGGGVKVNNGSINTNADGTFNKPILQKFKEAGKSTGCVTTVPITHATPAGFCVSIKSRRGEEEIASMYLDLRFDVMMGGGLEFFLPEKRIDKRDLFAEYSSHGFHVARNLEEMKRATPGKPLLGVFYEDGLPFTLDQMSDSNLIEKIPTLASMTEKAISLMSSNPDGFVLQVEGGKVDWAAHSNDAGALFYDQLAFDEAIAVAIRFAEKNNDTLIIMTSDHGTANPSLNGDKIVEKKFDLIQHYKQTNEWILNGISKNNTPAQIIERVNHAQGMVITQEEAANILSDYLLMDNEGLYNPYKLPYDKLAEIQRKYTSIGWAGMNHSSDYTELAMFGPGSESLPPFVKNSDLHKFMLEAAGMSEKR